MSTSCLLLVATALLFGVIIAFARPGPKFPALRASLLTHGLFLLAISGLVIELVCCFLKGDVMNGRRPARRATKIHAMVDWRGRPIAREVTPLRLGDVRVAMS